MAYQNVFVRITDVNGSRQSYSCRKKVNWVDTDMYFSNGARVSAMARYNKENQSCPVIDSPCVGDNSSYGKHLYRHGRYEKTGRST